MRKVCYIVGYGAVAWLSLWLRSSFGKYAIGPAAYDDALFVRSAIYLRNLQWLGPYDNLTLAKGSFYSFFIACANYVHLPLNIAEQSLYLLVAFCMSIYLARATANWALGLVTFFVLSLNPIFWNHELSRVVREDVYVSMSMAVVLISMVIFFPSTKTRLSRGRRIGFGVVGGLIAACFWMTREEGVWIFPAIAIIAAFALTGHVLNYCNTRTEVKKFWRGSYLSQQVLPAIAAAAGFTFPIGLVSAINYVHYGEFQTVEFHASAFVDAYGAVSRIQHDHWQRYVIFPKDARERAFKVSEAARLMDPFWEGKEGAFWAKTSCAQIGDPACVEIGSGWFLWAFREAASKAANIRTGGDALRFYRRLANEINSACDSGEIPCDRKRSTLAPAFRPEYVFDSIYAAGALAPIMARLGDGTVGAPPSIGSVENLNKFRSIVKGITAPNNANWIVSGWVATAGQTPKIKVLSAEVTSNITLTSAEDVKAAYPEMGSVRFHGTTSCPEAHCEILVRSEDHDSVYPFTKQGIAVDEKGVKIFLDTMQPAHPKVLSIGVQTAGLIATLYYQSLPIFEWVSAVGVAIALVAVWTGAPLSATLTLSVSSLVAVVTRVALLSYMDVTSMPSLNILYSSPASGFVLLFIVTGIYSGFAALPKLLPSRRVCT